MRRSSSLIGASFLMATSAIGPGFLVQTTVFTQQLLTSLGFIILISVLLDIGAQLNIWRIVGVSGKRAQDLANDTIPYSGYLLSTLIALGGIIFNIGNIAGCGLGLNVLTGMDVRIAGGISAVIALGIFWYREAGFLLDNVAKYLGLVMILLTLYIAVSSSPPVGEALYRTFWPEKISFPAIVTLVGGTVGGYISFAGAHRLLDAGFKGKEHLREITNSSVRGILITAVMRFVLFLAALGVIVNGFIPDPGNPPASIFRQAAGGVGYIFFGVVMWCAAITSVVGASYTSVSFWKTFHSSILKHERWVISAFILVSAAIFIIIGTPVRVLIFAGLVNGFILPLALAIVLIAFRKNKKQLNFHQPVWIEVLGWVVVVLMAGMSVRSLL